MELDNVTVREMRFEDLDEVLSIEASSSLSPWSKKMFVEEILNPLAYCFIIENQESPTDQVVGFVCFRNVGDESELFNIAVHPQQRQVGIGKKLMQFYFHLCEEIGIKIYYLEVNTLNLPAICFYQSLHYERIGVRKKFYEGKFDALLMIKKD